MPDNFKNNEISIQTLALNKVLEGLIHNINTPLNLILGYAQQLKKLYPEVSQIEKIYQAGLAIDDIMQSCARNVIHRLGRTYSVFDLSNWLADEVSVLHDVLEIKHKIKITTQSFEEGKIVKSSPLLLSLFFESLFMQLREKIDYADIGVVNLIISSDEANAMITMQIPESCCENDIEQYMYRLQTELEEYSGIKFTGLFPFSWRYKAPEIEITLSLQGTE